MILVFGGGGQVGSALAAEGGRQGVPLMALTRQETDIADAAAVAAALDRAAPALVVNAAAYTDVDRAEAEPESAMRVNRDGPAVLAAAAAERGLPLLHISTDFVFSGAKPAPYAEDDPVEPLSAYGRSKAEGEAAIRAATSRHVILRSAWIYGGRGRNFMTSILRAAAERDEIRMVSDQRGSPTFAADLAATILAIAPALLAGTPKWGTYHFAGAGEATRLDFTARIIAAQRPFTGRAPRLTPIRTADYPVPARRPANSALDTTRFTAAFGLRPRRWEEAVDDAVRRHFEGG